MKRSKIMPFGPRLNKKLDKLFQQYSITIFIECVPFVENIYLDNLDSIQSYQFMDVFKEAMHLGMLAQMNEDNIFIKRLDPYDLCLRILASDQNEAGKFLDLLEEEMARRVHQLAS